MKSKPLVSIIVPNYNHARYLPGRLDSIFNQTYQNYEVIILDDASTDNSIEIINQYKDLPGVKTLQFNRDNSGSPFIQWSKGLEYSVGKYLWIAESDDIASTQFLEQMVSLMESDDRIGLGFCQSVEIDHSDKVINEIKHAFDDFNRRLNSHEFVLQHMVDGNSIPNASAVLLRRECFEKYHLFTHSFKYAGDWYLYLCILSEFDCIISEEYLNKFRTHANTTRARKDEQAWVRALEELLRIHNLLLDMFPYDKTLYLQNVRQIIESINIYRNFTRLIKERFVGSKNTICIYGAGTLGQYCFELIKTTAPDINIAFFIDQKAGAGAYQIDGTPVYTLEDCKADDMPSIFIASFAFMKEIRSALEARGMGDKVLNLGMANMFSEC